MTRRTTTRRFGPRAVLGAALVAALTLTAAAAPPFAKANTSGDSLAVPADQASKGTVYYALPGRDRQVYFETNAPLENIKGQSNRVIGYVVAGDGSSPARLQGGEWHLPIKSMRTGIAMRDKHMAGKDWLDAEASPDIVFQIDKVQDITPGKASSSFASYKVTLVGDMTLHGVTRPMSIPATLTFLQASDKTARVASGDLLAIKAKYTVKLSDFGVSHPVIGKKVADTIELNTVLYMSTIPPERQPKAAG